MTPFRARVSTLLMSLGLSKFVVFTWRLRGRDTRAMQSDTLKGRFETIYATGNWAPIGSETLSGYGSTMKATEHIRAELPALLTRLGATSLLDVGCGDFNWMQHVDLPCPYIGVDIVASLVAENQRRYGNDRRRFETADGTSEPLPAADVALCREVLFHLSFEDAKKLLANIRATGARYLIATSDHSVRVNGNIPSGGWRDINLRIAPFNQGEPVTTIADRDQSEGRELAVWAL